MDCEYQEKYSSTSDYIKCTIDNDDCDEDWRDCRIKSTYKIGYSKGITDMTDYD